MKDNNYTISNNNTYMFGENEKKIKSSRVPWINLHGFEIPPLI